jgi:hypothetical protein
MLFAFIGHTICIAIFTSFAKARKIGTNPIALCFDDAIKILKFADGVDFGNRHFYPPLYVVFLFYCPYTSGLVKGAK